MSVYYSYKGNLTMAHIADSTIEIECKILNYSNSIS